LLPTKTSLSLSSSTSFVGFKVEIGGNLTCNGKRISQAPILLSYSVTGGQTWNDITSVGTYLDGSYSAVWIPSATGTFLVKASWAGNDTFPSSNALRALSVTAFNDQYVFSVSSNSTVSALAFNSTSKELGFTVSGSSGTMGFVDVAIAKNLVTDVTGIKVYLDGNQLNYTVASMQDSWLLHFTYQHSTHSVMINLETIAVPEFTSTAITITLLVAMGAIIIFLRKRSRFTALPFSDIFDAIN
jgi:hypothetical protein